MMETARPLTARQLNRATLARQLLLERQRLDVVEAVRRIGRAPGAGGRPPRTSRSGTGSRTSTRPTWTPPSPTRPIVKAQLMRITLHAVAADDYPAFHEAMQPTLRGARLYDRRFKGEGVSIADTEALVPDLLEFTASPRTEPRGRGVARGPLRRARSHASGGRCGSTARSSTRRPAGRGRSGRGPSYVGARDPGSPGGRRGIGAVARPAAT